MLTQEECDRLNRLSEGTMHGTMGVRYLPSDDNAVWGEMPISTATRQYFGILHGGAAIAMAETLAGCGSLHLIGFAEDKKICGISVTANHVRMSPKEGKVLGKATLIHGGRTTHIWNVDILDEQGNLISTERVTNMVIQ